MKCLWILVLLLFLFPFKVLPFEEKKTLEIAAYHIPGLVEESPEEPGFLLKRMREIFSQFEKEFNVSFEVEFYPVLRARERFESGKSFGLILGFKEVIGSKKFLASDPIAQKTEFLFSLKGENSRNILKKENYTVAATRGFFHSKEALDSVEGHVIKVDSVFSGLKMLKKGRVDLILGDDAATVEILLDKNIQDVYFDPKHPVGKASAHFFLPNNKPGQKLMKRFNHLIAERNLYLEYLKHIRQKVEQFREQRK